MKKYLGVILVFIFFLPIHPASGIFGLSKCEKVKKEMVILEKSLIGVRARSEGTLYKQSVSGSNEDIWEPTMDTMNKVNKVISQNAFKEIWKLGTNNPKCFTNTQRIQIKRIGQLSMTDLIYFQSVIKYSQTLKCVKVLSPSLLDITYSQRVFRESCVIGKVQTIVFVYDYGSIYTY